MTPHWIENARGNWQYRHGERRCTVFKTRYGDWKYVIEGAFSERSYEDADDAQEHAVAAIGNMCRVEGHPQPPDQNIPLK